MFIIEWQTMNHDKKGYDENKKSNFRVVQTCSRKYNYYNWCKQQIRKKIKSS